MGTSPRWRPGVAGGAMTTFLVSFHMTDGYGLPSNDLLCYQTDARDSGSAVAKAMHALDGLGLRIDRLTYWRVDAAKDVSDE